MASLRDPRTVGVGVWVGSVGGECGWCVGWPALGLGRAVWQMLSDTHPKSILHFFLTDRGLLLCRQ